MIIVYVLGAIFICAVYFIALHDRMTDFEVFHRAGERFLLAENLYQATDGHYQFKYLPASAMLFIPLAVLPIEAAKLIWLFVIVASILGIVFTARRLCGHEQATATLVVLTVLVTARFFVREVDLGQSNAAMTALLLLAVQSVQRKKEQRAGIYLGLATLLKPYALILLPLLLIRKQLVASFVAIAILLLGLLAPLIFYGWNGNIDLLQGWRMTTSSSTPSLLTNPDSVSLFACSVKWFGSDNKPLVILIPIAAVLVMLIAVAISILRSRRISMLSERNDSKAPDALTVECAIVLILIPLVSPQAWEYVFLTATLGTMLLLTYRQLLPHALSRLMYGMLAVIPLSLYDVLGRAFYYRFMGLSLLTPVFVFIVACLIFLRGRAVERHSI